MIPLGIRQSGMGDILCPDLAGAPGKQRTPTSRAWNWPHCGLAMGMLVVLRATGWVLQETQSLNEGRETRGTCPYLSSLQMSSARTGENQWSVPRGRTEPVRDPAQ